MTTARVYLKQPEHDGRPPRTFIVNASSWMSPIEVMKHKDIPSIGDRYDEDKLSDFVCESINVKHIGGKNFEVLCLYEYQPPKESEAV